MIAYVGDRADNDVGPAIAAGMVGVHIRRGPWGHLQEPPPARSGSRRSTSCRRCSHNVSGRHRCRRSRARARRAARARRSAVRLRPRPRRPLRRRRARARARRRGARRRRAGGHRLAASRPTTSATTAPSSLDLLREAYQQVEQAGWQLVNADCILIGEQPRIAPQREEMRRRLSEALGGGEVNVRATTTDHLGFTGRGEGLCRPRGALSWSAPEVASRAIETPIGTLGLVGSDAGLRMSGGRRPVSTWTTRCAVLDDAAAQLDAYFAGDLTVFDLPLDLGGTEFQRRCWLALATIPYGQTVSYGEQARRLGLGAGLCARSRCRERPESAPARAAVPPRDRRRRLADRLRRRPRS